MQTVVIEFSSEVGSGYCVAVDDGQRVYAKIRETVLRGDRVVLSFADVTRMTTAFLNAAVGQLYGEFTSAQITNQLGEPIKYEEWHLARLRTVTHRAREFFKDQKRIGEKISSITGEESHDS